jgi:hypothetical protein
VVGLPVHGAVGEALAVVGDEVVLRLTLLDLCRTDVALFQPDFPHFGFTKQSLMNGCYQPEGATPLKFADGDEVVKRPTGKRTSALARFWPRAAIDDKAELR